jgi:pimeloyl-ACP methyl ester carboxylesterase
MKATSGVLTTILSLLISTSRAFTVFHSSLTKVRRLKINPSRDVLVRRAHPSALPVCEYYDWKGHQIRYTLTKGDPSKPCVVFVHGFGASLGQFREQLRFFAAANYTTAALDLLGFGQSAKPLDVTYSIETWSEVLGDFIRDRCPSAPVLVGNSIGSLVSLKCAVEYPVRGLVLLNCAGGMNSKLLLTEPWPWPVKELVMRPLFALFDWVLTSESARPFARQFFDDFRSRENVEAALKQVSCLTLIIAPLPA